MDSDYTRVFHSFTKNSRYQEKIVAFLSGHLNKTNNYNPANVQSILSIGPGKRK